MTPKDYHGETPTAQPKSDAPFAASRLCAVRFNAWLDGAAVAPFCLWSLWPPDRQITISTSSRVTFNARAHPLSIRMEGKINRDAQRVRDHTKGQVEKEDEENRRLNAEHSKREFYTVKAASCGRRAPRPGHDELFGGRSAPTTG